MPSPIAPVQDTAFTTTAPAEADVSQPPVASREDHAPPKSINPNPRAIGPDLLRGLLLTFMAMDHNAAYLGAWAHGTGVDNTEDDSQVVTAWNGPLPYVLRTLSHACAPGFAFLLGMGVVYFCQSRRQQQQQQQQQQRLGWTTGSLVRHFLARAVVLTLLCVPQGMVVPGMVFMRSWFANMVLLALAVDYLLVGLLWVTFSRTETSLAVVLLGLLPDHEPDHDAAEPLLQQHRDGSSSMIRAARASWHLHNLFLLAVSVVTIFWNIWMSPTHGHCSDAPHRPVAVESNPLLRIWFHVVVTPTFMSLYPPLAWLSFAVLGLLYGRIMLARPWSKSAISLGTASAGLAFAVIFLLTRIFRSGNLSENCLHAPEHAAADPQSNPYFASPQSFFYIVKYPPDVAFWAFSMAVDLFLLAVFSWTPTPLATRANPLMAYGTSALFFYVVHFVLLIATTPVFKKMFGHWSDTATDPTTGERGAMVVDNAWAVFGQWLVLLACMHPLCLWYGAFKKTRGPDSVWRFF